MIPIRTRGSNFVYRGPAPDVGDAWVERHRADHAVYLTWLVSDEDRAAIAAGANIRLGIYGMEPIPPVSVDVTTEVALSEAGCQLRDRALRALVAQRREDRPDAPGWWVVSGDVWQALNDEQALDPSRGVPTLLGRPLIMVDIVTDHLEFNVPDTEVKA